MNNDIGENLETPSVSPTGTTTTDTSDAVNPQGAAATGSPEEVEFNSLKGGTQDRIKAIIRERDQVRAEAEVLRNSRMGYQQPPQFQPQPQLDLSNPQVRQAVDNLSQVGISTDAKVDQKISQSLGHLIYNFTLNDLENKHDGSNSLPKFDRAEYQDFVQRNPKYSGYDPEDVYNIMYSEEIMDAKMKTKGVVPTKINSSLRPTSTQVREEQWTPEAIETRMKEPGGMDWYRSHKELVNRILSSQTPQSGQ